MKKIKSLLVACTLTLSCCAISVKSISTKAEVFVNPPTLTYDNITYNMAVVYTWQAGAGADRLAISTGYDSFQLLNSTSHTEICFPDYTGENICDIKYINAKSYNSTAKAYSEMATIEYWRWADDGLSYVSMYGYPCQYVSVGQLDYGGAGYFPTSYDEDDFIWSHQSKNGHTIKGTIEYNGACSDIEVSIPWIGVRSTSVTLNGVTFSLRTGPNKCSIRCEQSGIAVNDAHFAFGVD